MYFPSHKPTSWELFKDESIECKNRRAAIANSRAKACRETKENPLWWNAQKYIDQVVPAEFIHPSEIDTASYRYQVFARPPPIQCPPRSLREVTDEPPPIRYNVKRIAIDKQYPYPRYECSSHWAKNQSMPQRNGSGSECCERDISGNNSSRPARPNALRSTDCESRGLIYSDNNSGFGKSKPLQFKSNNMRLPGCRAGFKGDSEQIKETVNTLDENNSRACPSFPMSNNRQNHANVSEPTNRLKLGSAADLTERAKYIKIPETTTNVRQIQSMLYEPQKPCAQSAQDAFKTESSSRHNSFLQNGNFQNEQTHCIPNRPKRSGNSTETSCFLSGEKFGNQFEDNCLKSTTDQDQPAPFSVVSRISHYSTPQDLKPQPLGSHSIISSRSSSPCSNSTVSSLCSTQKVSANNVELTQRRPGISKSCLVRESMTSLLSERKGSPLQTPIIGRGKKQFPALKSAKVEESVASLLSNSNENNSNLYDGSTIVLRFGAMQDIFAESAYSTVRRNYSNLNNLKHDNITENISFQRYSFGKTSSPFPRSKSCSTFLLSLNKHGDKKNLCKNNNSSAGPQLKHDQYVLKCCPLKTNKIDGFSDPDKQKMLCRFHGKQPEKETLPGQSFVLDQVVPIDPHTWKVKNSDDPKELQCTQLLSNCQTGKPLESSGGPLMVCEPRQHKPPPIGYGTYKIVGGIPRREEPLPNTARNLMFSPDIEEYREFIKRCPNYKIDRYDRTNPLNEMLLPSNRSTVLLMSFAKGPYTFTRMPRQKLPPLFKPLKKNSDLTWRLPDSYVKNDHVSK